MSDEEHIGDGVYALFEGYDVRLRTERMDGDHFVYLEPIALKNLLGYLKRCGWKDIHDRRN